MDKKYFETINAVIIELEDAQLFKEAEDLHNLFLKTAGKKKKSKGKNVPNDPVLYARCKSEAKKKFDVWPSAYGSAYLVKLYKSRGGTFRKSSSENIKTAIVGRTVSLKSNNPQPVKNDKPIDLATELKPEQSVFSPESTSQIEQSIKPTSTPEVTGNSYLEMPYKQVIEKAKELFLNRKKDEADKLIDSVVKGSIVLNDAQKIALKEHYNRIKFVFGDFGPPGTKNIPSQAYQEANDLIYRLKRKYNLEDKELLADTSSYYLVLNGIKSYKGFNPEFTNKVKNYANNLLRQVSMDYKNK